MFEEKLKELRHKIKLTARRLKRMYHEEDLELEQIGLITLWEVCNTENIRDFDNFFWACYYNKVKRLCRKRVFEEIPEDYPIREPPREQVIYEALYCKFPKYIPMFELLEQGWKISDIPAKLGISRATVYQRINKIKKYFK